MAMQHIIKSTSAVKYMSMDILVFKQMTAGQILLKFMALSIAKIINAIAIIQ